MNFIEKLEIPWKLNYLLTNWVSFKAKIKFDDGEGKEENNNNLNGYSIKSN